MFSRRLRVLIAAGVLSGLMPTAAVAAENEAVATPPSPKFDIREFRVEGNSLLSESDVAALVNPHTGASRDFGDVQKALEALQDAYQEKGYSAVQVFLPEQELEQGVVHFRVVEQRISSVTIEGNEYYEDGNVMRGLPSIAEGVMPNMKEVRRGLKLANENPTKQTAILFRSNDDEETVVDATVKVIDEKPWKAFLTLDNTGNRETLHGRIGLGFQHYNLFGKDHRITVQYITNTHFPQSYFNPVHKLNVLGGAYTIPFYEWGDSLDFILGYSDVSAANPQILAQTGITIVGKGLVLGAHYNHNFDKVGDYDHKLTAAVDYRAFRSNISALDSTPVSTVPLSLTYAGLWQAEQRQLSFSFGGSWNLFKNWVAHGGDDIYALPSANANVAEDDFDKYNFSVDYIQPFAKTWQFHAALSGQLTNDHLVPGERFRVGGMDTVRGWHEGALSGDRGYRWSVEFISPDFGNKISENVGLRGLIFVDKGYINNNTNVAGASAANTDRSIGSIGAGLRYNYKKDIVARFDYACVVDGDTTKDNPLGSRLSGDTFGHVSLGWIW